MRLLFLSICILISSLKEKSESISLKKGFLYINPERKFRSSHTGIQFIEQDWEKALRAAKAENKLIFLDIYATWCGPCNMLKKHTFSNKEAGEFFNDNFINISVDGEKGIGPYLAQQYAIQGYPTLIIADASGTPVLCSMGYISSKKLLRFGKEALKKK